ncbi:MAG: YidC/Oxa1 family rane protein insertase [Sphingomonadales bacterium]|nr:YidC/Oxa1 family rane protein insertase [Sphingomonadales bacterium]
MNEHRNIILAVVLSALVLIGWTFISQRWIPTANPPATKTVNGKQVPLPRPQASPSASTPMATRDRATMLRETPRIAIDTPRLHGSIGLKGARIDDLVLTQHRESIAANSPPIRLLSPAGAPDAYFASYGWTGEGIALPGPDTVWTASGNHLTPGSPVILSWTNPQGLRFDIAFAVDDSYLFTVEQRVSNPTGGAVAVRPWALVSRADESHDKSSYSTHIGPVGVFNGAANYSWTYKDLTEKGDQRLASSGGWIGFTDKYWLTALVPDQASNVDASFRHAASGAFQADYAPPQAVVQPGKALTYRSHFFAGAKEVKLLDRYTASLGTPLERAIDWGWFRWFMKPIFMLLMWLYDTIGNFGFAIICLTLIIRTLLFPVAQKQFRSMAAMRVVQPKMKELQERHKDDKPRMQQEILKLYQEEKVNPMAGCLPILLQIPIFYALYKTLLVSVEMRHKPFILWIRDLSAPDPMTPVNLFGYLHFTPPAYLALGVLPILFGVTMYFQTKLNPPVADPVQQQMMAMMPWVMMFIFAPFAAGLQLYYVFNNLYGLAQQRWLYARYSPEMLKERRKPAKA